MYNFIALHSQPTRWHVYNLTNRGGEGPPGGLSKYDIEIATYFRAKMSLFARYIS